MLNSSLKQGNTKQDSPKKINFFKDTKKLLSGYHIMNEMHKEVKDSIKSIMNNIVITMCGNRWILDLTEITS